MKRLLQLNISQFYFSFLFFFFFSLWANQLVFKTINYDRVEKYYNNMPLLDGNQKWYYLSLPLDLGPSLLRQGKHARGEVVTYLYSHLNVWKVQGKKTNIFKCILIFGVQSWLEVVGCFESLDENLKDQKFGQIKLFLNLWKKLEEDYNKIRLHSQNKYM
jgi:hypothetical protein